MSDEFDDFIAGLEDDDVEEVEDVEEAPAPKRTKKKAKKKAAAKRAPAPEPEEEEEAPAPKRTKKKAKKKAASKPAPAPEPEEVEDDEPEEEAPAPKPKAAKKKRAARKAAPAGDGVLADLGAELNTIVTESGNSAEIDRLKAEIRSGKKLATQIDRFAKRATKAAEAQEALVEKLEAQLAKLEG